MTIGSYVKKKSNVTRLQYLLLQNMTHIKFKKLLN